MAFILLPLCCAVTASGCRFGKKNPKPASGASAPSGESRYSAGAARRAKANAEILNEMVTVVFQQNPSNRSQFGSYLDSLNQGASFEGIYNGFVHSARYREMENTHPPASSAALKVFSEERKLLLLPPPDAKTSAKSSPKSPMERHENDLAAFKDASLYKLKRILGNDALKLMTHKLGNGGPESLARWYAPWATRMAGYQVDFGLALRNKPDEKFHYQWARSADEEQVKWEVLNRLHRLLNEANRK